MKAWTYLGLLVISLGGLLVLDWRYRLALWLNAKRALLTLLIGEVVFCIWDVLGVALGIFLHGNGPYALSVRIYSEFPPEELLFICLLCYSALIIYRGFERRWPRT